MKVLVRGTEIEIEPNSRPYFLKRLLADGFDIALIFMTFVTLTLLLMKTPLGTVYSGHLERYKAIQEETLAAYGDDQAAVAGALKVNQEYQDELFAANLHAYLLKALACFLVEAVILLAFPLIRRDRSTPGKILTGALPFNETRQTRATRMQIVSRFLFVFLIDSLVWYLFAGILTFLLVPVLRIVEMLVNKKHKTICDAITGVMIIEKKSYDGLDQI